MHLTHILLNQAKLHPNKPAFGYKVNGAWQTITFNQYKTAAQALSRALVNRGLTKGAKVASITFNRPEWNILDMAILLAGGVHVSLYPNFNFDDYAYSLDYTDAEFVFVAGKLTWQQVKKIANTNPKIKEVFVFDALDSATTIQQLIDEGNDITGANTSDTLSADDMAAIYLTSGTTGKSKGALVTHRAIMNTVEAMKDMYDIKADDRAISYAPLCVSSERSLNYFYQHNGICTYYAENMLSIVQNMQEIKPTIFLGSPLLLEKIRTGTIEKAEQLTGIQKFLFGSALAAINKMNTEKRKLAFNPFNYFFDKLIYARIRDVMGGQVRFIMAGGASIPIDIMKFFWAVGIPVYEGYGMTECHIMSVNSDKRGIKFGTVGPLFKDVEIVLNTDGEILCRSPYLFSGYYKMPEQDKASFDEFGFFKTGDKGEWIDNKFLKVTGRLKDIFKTTSGKYVVPEAIEKKLNQSPYISQSIITGANQKHITALITPDFSAAKKSLLTEAEAGMADEELIKHPKLLKAIQAAIDDYNTDFTETEQVKQFHLLAVPFTIDSGELTPSMKLKRQVIEKKHAHLITATTV